MCWFFRGISIIIYGLNYDLTHLKCTLYNLTFIWTWAQWQEAHLLNFTRVNPLRAVIISKAAWWFLYFPLRTVNVSENVLCAHTFFTLFFRRSLPFSNCKWFAIMWKVLKMLWNSKKQNKNAICYKICTTFRVPVTCDFLC